MVPPGRGPAAREWVRAWKPVVAGVREVFRYDLERRHRGAGGERVTILPPHVVHDGRAAGEAGFRKRVLYLGTEVIDERLVGQAVDALDIRQPGMRRALGALHEALGEPDDALEAEARLAIVAERLRSHLGGPAPEPAGRHPARLARELLDARLFVPTTLAEVGRALGVSPAHLVRSFTATFGIAPHQYLVARRVDAARWRLLDGQPIARVAVDVGFYDQAHFTRQFKRHVGTPPGRYALSTRGGR
jgi:AraC-like DNA-binding protein